MKTETTRRVLQNDFSANDLIQRDHPGARYQDLGRYRVFMDHKTVVGVWNRGGDGQFTMEESC
jgi:hypothetical protein